MFAQRGFDEVSAEEIVAASGVTRGALYHHFDGKKGLFRQVLTAAMRDVRERIIQAARQARDPMSALEEGARAFLRQCADPANQRVLVVDGPAVLGWHAWRSLDLEHGVGLLREGLRRAAASQQFVLSDIDTASHLVAGALIDGAMLIASAPDDRTTRRRVEQAALGLLRGLFRPQAGHRPGQRAKLPTKRR